MIGKKEIALIHVAKAQLGLPEDIYRSILSTYGGVNSSKNLSQAGFKNVLKRFQELGFKLKLNYQENSQATVADPNALPTPAHLHKINSLYDELNWETQRRLGFNKRTIKKNWPQTREEANKIIEALKAMVARNRKSV